ncbi:MAG: hypothetical protein AAGC53_23075, partial [Actinomycetota bacterium]
AFTVTVHVDGPRSVAAQMYEAEYPGLELYNPDTGWRFAGEVTRAEWRRSSTGDDITFVGRDFQGFLNDRVLYPNTGDVTSAWSTRSYNTARASTMALAEMRSNAGDTSLGGRGLFGLTIGTDPVAGPILSYTIKNQVMLEAFQTWFADSDYTFRLGLIRPGNIGNVANLHFEVFKRPTSQLFMSPRLGNMEAFVITDEPGRPTHYIGVGRVIDDENPDAVQRYVIEAGTPQTDWKTRRREVLYSRPSSIDVDLFSEADQARLNTGATRSIQIEGAEVTGYGHKVGLGWYIPVQVGLFGDGAKEYLPVKASTVTLADSGAFQRTVDIGGLSESTEQRLYNAIGATTRRLNRLEQEL